MFDMKGPQRCRSWRRADAVTMLCITKRGLLFECTYKPDMEAEARQYIGRFIFACKPAKISWQLLRACERWRDATLFK
jgi:hypothetical protein